MSISHGHRPYSYSSFIPEMEADTLIGAVQIKQNQYDEGVSLIQQQWDALSNLPLSRDVDKMYMNNELNKISNIIQQNVGNSDFSNPSVVKSFLDISRPLQNDPVLKNAILSTEELQNRNKMMQDIMEKNPEKYNDANYWEYMNDVEEWMNNPNPGAKLKTKHYTPYTDLSKKISTVLKDLEPSIDSEISKMGGMFTIEEKKALKASKIKDALMASLNAHELKQLDIDAKYHTANMDLETKYNSVMRVYTDMLDNMKALSSIPGVENSTGMSKEDYEQEIAAITDILAGLRNAEGELNRSTVDQLYTNAYISDWSNGIGNAYSYAQRKEALKTDPFSLQSRKHSLDMSRLKQTFKYNMQLKGFELDEDTGEWNRASYYSDINKPKKTKTKPPSAPSVFESSLNKSLLEKIKRGERVRVSMGDLGSNNSIRFEDILLREGALTEKKNASSKTREFNEEITTVEVGADANGMLHYTFNIVKKDGTVVKKVISDNQMDEVTSAYLKYSENESPEDYDIPDPYGQGAPQMQFEETEPIDDTDENDRNPQDDMTTSNRKSISPESLKGMSDEEKLELAKQLYNNSRS